MFEKIRKRDGRFVEFDSSKITKAIASAGSATGEFEEREAKKMTLRVLTLAHEMHYGPVPEVEEIQDTVERVLLDSPFYKTAKAYILYREQHALIRNIATKTNIDLVDSYLQHLDWKIRENSNMCYSLQGLNNYISSDVTSEYWLSRIYPPELRRAHKDGDIHIHDLSQLSVYTYFGKEVIVVRYRGEVLTLSFEQLYDMADAQEEALNEKENAWAKHPSDLFVMDRDGWTRVTRLIRKSKDKPMRFMKNRGGRSVIVTEDHPMVTERGEVESRDVMIKDDKLFTVDMVSRLSGEHLFSADRIDLVQELRKRGFSGRDGDVAYFNGLPVSECPDDSDGVVHTLSFCGPRYIRLTQEFGFFVGLTLAEGYLTYDNKSYFITMTSRNREDMERANAGLLQHGWSGVITFRDHDNMYELRIRNRFLRFLFEKVFLIRPGSRNKTLPVGILSYSRDFLRGMVAGLLDGDGAANGKTGIQLRMASRTLLEQLAAVLPFIGLFPRDRNCEGVGSIREYEGRTITQNFPLYGLGFRKIDSVALPSDKYDALDPSVKAWQDETVDAWHEVLNNAETDIPEEYIYDITTETHTLVVNGMWNHNCVGWDLKDLLLQGFRGVEGKVESAPPRHLRTALGQLVNFIYTLQGESAGAQAVSNFDTLLAPFVRYDKLGYNEVKQAIQEFVFNANIPTRVGFQTPFFNITMDLEVPSTLKDHPAIIGGEYKNETYADFQPEMDMLNKAFAEIMMEGDATGRVFTFPIPTYNITSDFNWDNPDLDGIWEMTGKYGIPYFSNFCNSDMSPEDARSMCPLHPDTKVVVRAGRGMTIRTIKDVYYTFQQKKTEYEVLFNGKWYKGKLVANKTEGCTEYTLGNGEKVILDVRHEQPVKQGKGQPVKILEARNITQGMFLPFNSTTIDQNGENYDAGFAVGAFLGDGSYDGRGSLVYSLNSQEKETLVAKNIRRFYEGIGFKVTSSAEKQNVVFHLVRGSNGTAENWVSQFVKGRNAHEKRLTAWAFQMGSKFLQGVLDGWYATDGENRGRIYTVSRELCDDFAMLCGLLGKAYTIDKQGDSRPDRLGPDPVYTLKFHTRPGYGDHYFHEDGFWWFPVKNTRSVPEHDGLVYCFAVDSEDHLFQLGNGMVTHNCRLRLDNRELMKRGGGLFGANPLTGSIGVVTINLPRIGYVAQDEKDFFERLEQMILLSKKSLLIKRKILENFTDKNLYPYSKFYLREVREATGLFWKNHFSTIGIIGMNEACLNFMGTDIGTEEGQAFSIKIMDFIREMISEIQEETGDLFNLEATPAEGTSHRLAMLDREKFPEIIYADQDEACNDDVPYYTNSTQLPVNYTDDIFETLTLQDDLQTKYTGGCIEKGNKVITDKGAINIEEIVNQFKSLSPIKALSYNPETGQSEWDLITDAVTIDVAKHHKIKVVAEKGVEITTSDWHPFFVMEKISFDNQCPVCDESLKNVKAFATHLRYNQACSEDYDKLEKYKVVEKRADELRKGDYILQNAQNLLPEKSVLDPDLAYLIGFFIGDGSISEFKDNRGGNNLTKYKLRFFSEARQTLEKISDILNRFFECQVKPIQNDKRSEKLLEVGTSKKSVLDFMFEYQFFAGKKAYTITIPQEVKHHLSKQNFYSFLAGLIDSDGHVDERDGTVEYYTVSEKLADDIVEMCTIAGILVAKYRKTAQRENETDIFRVFISASQATRSKEQLPLQRAKDSIKEVLSDRVKRQLPVVRVLNTSKVEVEDNDFYDLTTEKNHNYLAGKNSFVFVHNTVLHVYLGEMVSDIDTVKNLIRKIATNFKLPYFTLTPTFSICPAHGYLNGEQERCPSCQAETEVYSRVVGYLRPVKQWNKGKQAEFVKRKNFRVRDAGFEEQEVKMISNY